MSSNVDETPDAPTAQDVTPPELNVDAAPDADGAVAAASAAADATAAEPTDQPVSDPSDEQPAEPESEERQAETATPSTPPEQAASDVSGETAVDTPADKAPADDAPADEALADEATADEAFAPDEAEPRPVDEPAEASEPPPKPAKPAGKKAAPEEFVEDGRADRALDFVVDVLTTMNMDCTVDLMENAPEDPPSDIRIEICGKDSDRLIGKKGQTLSAMQFLVNRVVNRPSLPRRHILIDAGGYRARREHALSSMARRLGKQAVADGKIITFEPMSAQDRRVVHLALAKFSGLVTKSEGKGATRRVQIIPVRE